MIDEKQGESWTTLKEMQFIDELGSFVKKSNEHWHGKTRKQLLESYIKTIPMHRGWGEIERLEIIAYARSALLDEMGAAA